MTDATPQALAEDLNALHGRIDGNADDPRCALWEEGLAGIRDLLLQTMEREQVEAFVRDNVIAPDW